MRTADSFEVQGFRSTTLSQAIRMPDRRATLYMAAVPALLAATVFANTLFNGFAYDDWVVITWAKNRHEDLLPLLLQYRGLTYGLHAIDWRLWGDWAPGFHLTNLILHSVASSLTAYAAFLLTRSKRVGLLCGLFFAVHPVHVEAVASIANRKDVLATIFACAALILWLRPRQTARGYVGALVSVCLSFLSKEIVAVGFVPMLFFADLLISRGRDERFARRFRRAVLRSAPFWILGAATTLTITGNPAIRFQAASIGEETAGQLRGYRAVLATAAASIPDIARLLFFPATLSADYPVRPRVGFGDERVRMGIQFLLAWSFWLFAALTFARRIPALTFAMLWTVVTYLPCSNVVPLTHFFIAERYLYAPSLGVCLLIAIGFDAGLTHTRERQRLLWLALTGAIIATTLAGGIRSAVRNRDWRDDVALAQSAVAAGQAGWRVHSVVGRHMFRKGDAAEADRHLRLAVELAPLEPCLRYDLAALLVATGRTTAARRQIGDAVSLGPLDAEALPRAVELGVELLRLGMVTEAAEVFAHVLRSDPTNAEARDGLERASGHPPRTPIPLQMTGKGR